MQISSAEPLRSTKLPLRSSGSLHEGFLGVSAIFGPDVWLPATMAAQVLPLPMQDILRDRAKPFFQAVARLKPGIDRSGAEANLQTIASSLQQEFPDANAGHTISVQPITTALFSSTGGEAGATFVSVVLLAIVGLVLIIACSNVANLIMARAVSDARKSPCALPSGLAGPACFGNSSPRVSFLPSSAELWGFGSVMKAAGSSGLFARLMSLETWPIPSSTVRSLCLHSCCRS